jgi:hypothetical protein
MHDPVFKEKISVLRDKVENFACQYPMPGLAEL